MFANYRQTQTPAELIDRVPLPIQQLAKHPPFGRSKPGERFALWAQWPAEHFGRFLDTAGTRMLVKKSEYGFDAVEERPGFLPALLLDAEIV